jgi:hypothetical protein
VLASYTMNQLGLSMDAPERRFWKSAAATFVKRYPRTGRRQLVRYREVARRVREALERLPAPERRRYVAYMHAEIIKPFGPTLEVDEIPAFRARMRRVTLALARRFNVPVPASYLPKNDEDDR